MEPSAKGLGPLVAIKLELVSWHGIRAYYHQEVGTGTYFNMIFVFQVTIFASLPDTNLR